MIAGAANETAAIPSAVRQTIQDPRVSIVAGRDAVERIVKGNGHMDKKRIGLKPTLRND